MTEWSTEENLSTLVLLCLCTTIGKTSTSKNYINLAFYTLFLGHFLKGFAVVTADNCELLLSHILTFFPLKFAMIKLESYLQLTYSLNKETTHFLLSRQ